MIALSFQGNDSNITSSGNTTRDRPFRGDERVPDSTDDKIKKVFICILKNNTTLFWNILFQLKIEVPHIEEPFKPSLNQPQNFSSGLNIQMEPNLSTVTHTSSTSSAGSHTLPSSSSAALNVAPQSQTFAVDRTSSSWVVKIFYLYVFTLVMVDAHVCFCFSLINPLIINTSHGNSGGSMSSQHMSTPNIHSQVVCRNNIAIIIT